jgi:signal peptidase I
VVALGGEQIEFRKGKLWVDGKTIEESYVRYPCDWDLPPRMVGKGSVYVVGDNRDMSIENHHFGQTSIKRIVGVPLW